MSRAHQTSGWGPSHQHRKPPHDRRPWIQLGAIALIAVGLKVIGERLQREGPLDAISSTLGTVFRDALIATGVYLLVRVLKSGHLSTLLPALRRRPSPCPADRSQHRTDLGAVVREHALRLGGGAFLGLAPGGSWITAEPEHAVMVLGPPRSGKTSSVVIPALLAAPGAAISTTTKPDVLRATWRSRSELGQVWLFDPSGEREQLPRQIRRLSWSPISAASSWDDALAMARAMAACTSVGRGTTNEQHWRERASALLAPLLYAANLSTRPISTVLRWVLRQDLVPARATLQDHDAAVADDVLEGIEKTDARERSSIFSATAGVLAAYNADATRRAAAMPNFDAGRFVTSSETIFITAPAHKQALCAPLVVGLLEEIRHATYRRAASGQVFPPLFLCLDEVANIAPIHDLPALVSEAGGQGMHVMTCLQDLSQARERWGDAAAEGLLSLFQTKLILSGIADSRTLEAVSLVLGEYDRQLVSHTLGRSRQDGLLPPPGTSSESVTYHTQRERTLPPGDVAKLPPGRGLLLRGTSWGLVRLTPCFKTEPWVALTAAEPFSQSETSRSWL
jgi:type IV secretory pathway TraG/TraD family ATPase VirD4